jgi:hypothetical protein
MSRVHPPTIAWSDTPKLVDCPGFSLAPNFTDWFGTPLGAAPTAGHTALEEVSHCKSRAELAKTY